MRGMLLIGAILSLLVACVLPMPVEAGMNYEHNTPTILSLDFVALDATDSGGSLLAERAALDAIANYEDLSNDRRINAVELAGCGLFGRLRGGGLFRGGLFNRIRARAQARQARYAGGC